MTLRSSGSRLIFSVCALLLSHAALADKQAQASVNTLGYQLIDLDTSDNIIPNIVFYPGFNTSFMQTYGSGLPATDLNKVQFDYSPLQLSLSTNRSSFSTEYTGGMLGQLHANANLRELGQISTGSETWLNFMLSPKTELVVFGNVTGFSRSNSGVDANGELAYGRSLLQLFDESGHGDSLQFVTNARTVGQFEQVDQNFSLHMVNNDVQNRLHGHYGASVQVMAGDMGATPAVPEPGTYAMMLGGLAVLGGLVRRRRACSTC